MTVGWYTQRAREYILSTGKMSTRIRMGRVFADLVGKRLRALRSLVSEEGVGPSREAPRAVLKHVTTECECVSESNGNVND